MKQEIQDLLAAEREYFIQEEEFLCMEADLKREQ